VSGQRTEPGGGVEKAAEARRRLLDRAPEPGEREAWAEHYARPERAKEKTAARAFVFRIGAEWLALPAGVMEEAASLRPIHSVPHRRGGALAGLANLNGELLPCMRLDHALAIEESAKEEKGRRLLVLRAPGGRLVFMADEVHGPLAYDAAGLRAAPSRPACAKALIAWGERTVGLLDVEALWPLLERGLG
jgi:chemotaxis-related protein WspD